MNISSIKYGLIILLVNANANDSHVDLSIYFGIVAGDRRGKI